MPRKSKKPAKKAVKSSDFVYRKISNIASGRYVRISGFVSDSVNDVKVSLRNTKRDGSIIIIQPL